MSFLLVNQLSRIFDLSEPWILRKIKGQQKKLLKAVDKVNFSIERGQTYALVGESGSGKSTIAMMVAGLIKPSSGFITIDGYNFFSPTIENNIKSSLRKSVQMIFQSPYASLNPRWRVGEVLKEPIKAFNLIESENEQKHRVCELLEQVGLSERDINKFPHEFSGGQRQRICIARSLASEPKLIICDEPTSALDVSVQAQVLNLLKDLQKQFSLTYLFISHDLAVVSTMANKIGVLKQGILVEEALPNKLFEKPEHDYTKMLLSAAPDIKNVSKKP